MTRESTEDVTARDQDSAERDRSDDDPDASLEDADATTADAAAGERDAEPDAPESVDTADELVDLEDDRPILLFDGVCNLCTGVVQFLIQRDPEGKLRYGSLQSDPGQALLERFGLPTDTLETFVLVEGDRCYTRSAAALRVAKHLGRPYSWLYPLRHVPRPIRDGVYGLVARYRYRIFGQKDQCMMPPPDWESRFIEQT